MRRSVLRRKTLYRSVDGADLWPRPVLVYTAIALCASVVVAFSFGAARSSAFVDPKFFNALVPSIIYKTQTYYVSHAIAILAVLAAGLAALKENSASKVKNFSFVWLFFFMISGLLMGVSGFSISEMMSIKLVGSTGPFICFVSFFMFVGSCRENWGFISKSFVVISIFLIVKISLVSLSVDTSLREYAVSNLHTYMMPTRAKRGPKTFIICFAKDNCPPAGNVSKSQFSIKTQLGNLFLSTCQSSQVPKQPNIIN